MPYWKLSFVVGTLVACVVAIVSWIFPLSKTLSGHVVGPIESSRSFFEAQAWSPVTSGILLGLLQVPTFFLLDQNIGISASYVLITGLIANVLTRGKASENIPFYKQFFSNGDYGQLGCAFGIFLGAMLSVHLSGVVIVQDPTATAARSFLGGFFVLFGARMAGGCASGHGLSGTARLSSASIVVTFAFFAGAISSAVIGL